MRSCGSTDDGHRQGRPCPAVPLAHAVRAGLSPRDPREGLRRPRPGVALLQGRRPRGINNKMKGGGETTRGGKAPPNTRRFLQMCGHYLVEPVACTPASGWEKGQVE